MAQQREAIAVAPLADFPDGSHKVVKINGREVGIFNVGGTFHALPNLCPHQLGPLCLGRVSGTLDRRPETGWQLQWIHDGEIVTCPWHGMEYHISTGQCLAYPEVRLRTYEVWVEDGMVMLRK
ncbi:MAG: Rieske 2Fe-2S domain-containing protein [Anaerolineae bacterium]|nr:Rieske 2Fe-2S domain-containing protein [Anaerolineae bacterium]